MPSGVVPVGEDVPLHPRVLAAAADAERDLDASLHELIAELEAPLDGGLVDADWRLDLRYDFPTIIREAVEERLADDPAKPASIPPP